jgi:hypothetical protein
MFVFLLAGEKEASQTLLRDKVQLESVENPLIMGLLPDP